MAKIIGVADGEYGDLYVVEVRTVTRAPETTRHWRARVNALAAAGLFGTSVDLVRELPRGKVERATQVVREIQTESNLASDVWEVQIEVK